MVHARVNAVVDLFGGIVFLFVLLSVLVSLWVLPAGGRYRGGLGLGCGGGVFLGLLRSEWAILHSLGTALMVGLGLVYHALHWRFIRNMRRYLFRAKDEKCIPRCLHQSVSR